MTFFQNPFSVEFRGNWVLGDRSQSLVFDVPPNTGRSETIVVSYAEGPYDMSGNDGDSNSELDLTYSWAIDAEFQRWATHTVTITPSSSSAVTVREIVTDLNADSVFASYFTASVAKFNNGVDRLMITTDLDSTKIKFFIHNGKAETLLKFNARAGVKEIPTYFDRHRIGAYNSSDGELVLTNDRFEYTDCASLIIGLDNSNSNVDDDVVDEATDKNGSSLGLDSTTVQADYQLLNGRSGLYTFKKITVDGSDRITEIIEYQAGAGVGDLARKTTNTYTSTNTFPDQTTEIPYTLASGDLVTP